MATRCVAITALSSLVGLAALTDGVAAAAFPPQTPLPLPLGGLTLRVSQVFRCAMDRLLGAILTHPVRLAIISRAVFMQQMMSFWRGDALNLDMYAII